MIRILQDIRRLTEFLLQQHSSPCHIAFLRSTWQREVICIGTASGKAVLSSMHQYLNSLDGSISQQLHPEVGEAISRIIATMDDEPMRNSKARASALSFVLRCLAFRPVSLGKQGLVQQAASYCRVALSSVSLFSFLVVIRSIVPVKFSH